MTTTDTRGLNVPIPEPLYRRLKARAGADLLQLKTLVPILLEKGLEVYEAERERAVPSDPSP